ncbi:hypothetical protein AWZ03_007719 [Drosophila navojoa]|uniref:Uncharacterized protein n=1 Tax=Drosophila navojoa TaxID=7232 RepID=A0A484BB28_DRONA|nr:hypothetical protein AWZ03_007719 [Drosophila navojoa]
MSDSDLEMEDLKSKGFRLRLPKVAPLEDDFENMDINNPSVRVETVATTLQDLAYQEFLFEMDVPRSRMNPDKEEGVPLYKAYSLDLKTVMRRLFHGAVDNCGRVLCVEDQLIMDVAKKLKRGIFQPRKANWESPLLLRLVPAIALDRSMGAVVAYGMGQLLIRKKNDRKKRMIFKGYTRNLYTQQVLIKSVAQSLLTRNDVED